MNSLIVACGYYQYNMLNINNLFQNGIIMILIPPNCTKYLFCAIKGTRFTIIAYIISILLHLVNQNYCTKVLSVILIT